MKLSKLFPGLGSNASKKPKAQNIHTVFKQWIEKSPDYKNLTYQFGPNVFERDHTGEYIKQPIRLAFEAFKMTPWQDGKDEGRVSNLELISVFIFWLILIPLALRGCS